MPETSQSHIATGFDRITHSSPFQALREGIDNVLSGVSRTWNGGRLCGEYRPSIDVCELDNTIEVKVDLPGIAAEDVHVQLRERTLQITGDRKDPTKNERTTWHRTERPAGRFSRDVILPCDVQDDKIDACYGNGVLTIRLPKVESEKSHRIPVRNVGRTATD